MCVNVLCVCIGACVCIALSLFFCGVCAPVCVPVRDLACVCVGACFWWMCFGVHSGVFCGCVCCVRCVCSLSVL